jgi:hypothetical protein
LALECEINGQLYKGEADLVLETSEGYILFDYKSYLGGMDNVLNISSNGSENPNFAGKYAGQLDTYSKMIEYITDRKVIKTFIYYTILGKLVEISKIYYSESFTSIKTDFDYDQHFGGVYYLFLRGVRADRDIGIYHFRPSGDQLDKMEEILKIENAKSPK